MWGGPCLAMATAWVDHKAVHMRRAVAARTEQPGRALCMWTGSWKDGDREESLSSGAGLQWWKIRVLISYILKPIHYGEYAFIGNMICNLFIFCRSTMPELNSPLSVFKSDSAIYWYYIEYCLRFWISLYCNMAWVLSFPCVKGWITVRWWNLQHLPIGLGDIMTVLEVLLTTLIINYHMEFLPPPTTRFTWQHRRCLESSAPQVGACWLTLPMLIGVVLLESCTTSFPVRQWGNKMFSLHNLVELLYILSTWRSINTIASRMEEFSKMSYWYFREA